MRRILAVVIAAVLGGALFLPPAGNAAGVPPDPAWALDLLPTPTNFAPGDFSGKDLYHVVATNVGAAATDGSPLTLVDRLPAGVSVLGKPKLRLRYGESAEQVKDFGPVVCHQESTPSVTLSCIIPTEYSPPTGDEPSVLGPGEQLDLTIPIVVSSSVAQGSTLVNEASIEGGGAARVSASDTNPASSVPVARGLHYFHAAATAADGTPVTQAGSHPYQYRFSFGFNTKFPPPGSVAYVVPSGADPKDIRTILPPGLVGNALVAPQCTPQQFAAHPNGLFENPRTGSTIQTEVSGCPDASAMGIAWVRIEGSTGELAAPVYNMVPAPGIPAQLAFHVPLSEVDVYIDAEVLPDFRIVATVHNASEVKRLTAGSVTLWGTPADPSHDSMRGHCLASYIYNSIGPGPVCPSGILDPHPFWRLPTTCSGQYEIAMAASSYREPETFLSAGSDLPGPTGCDRVPFDPALEAHPTTDIADSPTGFQLDVHVPQPNDPEGIGEADLRDTSVTLPPGLVINPSGANGLGSCSEEQMGYLGKEGAANRFSDAAAACPQAAKIGTAEVETPLVDHPLEGSVYVATPFQNPAGSLLALYVATADPRTGLVIKLAGKVSPDPEDGTLTTTFEETPQLPFEDFKLEFFPGATAALRTPQVCGVYATTSLMTPWSAPESGPPARLSDEYEISRAPDSNSCPENASAIPHAPSFEAGTEFPIAGTSSPLVVNLRRVDGSQEISQITLHPPAGLLARLAGIPYCPDLALAAAAARSGREERAVPSCPMASRVGSVTVGAGAGPSPFYADGAVYLGGPYKGAPLSLAIITPAVAGPYDLGNVVVRTALRVDPENAQITAVSDQIPHVLDGIPLDIRSILLRLDHPGWGLNPTSCEPASFAGEAVSVLGQTASFANPFQVRECGALSFKPKLRIHLKGGTKRNDFPALKALLTFPGRTTNANVAAAQVSLPHSEFLEQGHIGTVCTRPQLVAKSCPAGSIYGRAKAWTPLLDHPLEGPVYLGTGFQHKLPDLVADLDGQIRVILHGKIDTTKAKGIRNTFEVVPDAPVSKFELTLKGGKRGLLVNSENICRKKQRANALFVAQNGRRVTIHPVIGNSCKRKYVRHGHHGPHPH
jgi:hypothetical protein